MLSYFYRILERDGQTDGQNCCINIARQHTSISGEQPLKIVCVGDAHIGLIVNDGFL